MYPQPMRLLIGLIFALLLHACASGPIIDTTGVNQAQYEQDLAQCEAIAEQVQKSKRTAGATLTGALIGGALGSITGSARDGATSGGILGLASGSQKTDEEEMTVIKNCLRNRGYKILN